LIRGERLYLITDEEDITKPLMLSCARLELSEIMYNLGNKTEALEKAKQSLKALDSYKLIDAVQKQWSKDLPTNILNKIKVMTPDTKKQL